MLTRFLTLTLNPAIDCTLSVKGALRLGGVHTVAGEVRTAGGKGVNVAKAIAAAGRPVRAGGLLGAADAPFYESELRPMGIDTRFLPVPYPTRCNIMAADSAGHELKLNRPGFPDLAYDAAAFERYARDVSADADVVVLSGSLPARFPLDAYARLVRLFRELGRAVVLDCSGPAPALAAAELPHVLKPNRRELAELVGHPLRTEKARLAEVRRLAGRVDVVILSDGARGAWFASRGAVLHAAAIGVAAVDTTGAGDWLLGQFCADYFEERALTPAVAANAVAAGAAAVQVRGTPFIRSRRSAR